MKSIAEKLSAKPMLLCEPTPPKQPLRLRRLEAALRCEARALRVAGSPALRVAGLMSGTSADGVAVAIADISPNRITLLAFDTFPYPLSLRRQIYALFQTRTAKVDDICHLNFVIGEVFADALIKLSKRCGIALRHIDLIGSHGQTIYHMPQGRRFGRRVVRSTLQIGEPSLIAERTGITTVADFRPRDIAAGGEGAPLVPYADYVLFRHRSKTRVIQNIGGIANVTFLPASCTIDEVRAFDTGPGNMMIDRIMSLVTRGNKSYDSGGRLAAKGKIHDGLLRRLMSHPFLKRKPPKSTGREEFGVQFSDAVYKRARESVIAPIDILATATAFTSESIADAYRRFLPRRIDEVILCGGGSRNNTLVSMLRERLRPAEVIVMDALGINADAKEALSFAILAYATIRGIPNNVPRATGARKPVVLGKVIPGKC